MITSNIILAAGWILFCVFHSVFASSKFKLIARRWMSNHYTFYRLYYTFFAFLSFIAVLLYLFTMPSYKLFTINKSSVIIGSIVSVLGLGIMSICIIKYFMQQSGLKKLFENKMSDELMTSGVHRIVRHPLYTGTFIFIWGLFILFPYASTLVTDAIITAYTLIGLRFEEKKLEKEFEIKYSEYKKQVPMLIPKLSHMRSNKSY